MQSPLGAETEVLAPLQLIAVERKLEPMACQSAVFPGCPGLTLIDELPARVLEHLRSSTNALRLRPRTTLHVTAGRVNDRR
jgi:hypothetical protein